MVERDFEHVTHFPVKLWDVVDDESNKIFSWSADGLSFFVDDHKYELEIMDRYPGFVQISSFANLRRLLREYSFDWQSNDTGEFQFSHPSFKKGDREAIFNIRTKRKAIQAAVGQPVKPRRRNSRNGKNLTDKSKAWMQPIPPSGKVNLRVDTLLRFPEKFWEVVNDCNDMLYWGDNGDTVIVDDKKYEDGIMTRYPGFVQINSFANLRRLLREYGFSWSICDNGFFEFSHTHMKKDRPELLKGVKTKRRAMKAGSHHPYLPFYRGDGAYHHHHHHGTKAFANGDQFESFDPELSTRSSPEIDQAIGPIQHPDGRHFHHHHHSSVDHANTGLPSHLYGGLHPYRVMPSYCSTIPNSVHGSIVPPSTWGVQPPSGEKMEPPFYYPTWNQDNQLRLPIPCDAQTFGHGDQEQTSPNGETACSNSEIRISSTGSSESVYASSSKDSPTDVFDQDQLDMSTQESSPASFPLMSLQSSSEDGYSAPCLNPSGKCQPMIEQPACTACDLYQPPSSNAFESEDVPMNLKTEVPSSTTSPTELSLSCSHLDDGYRGSSDTVVERAELNNNELKSDCDECEPVGLELANADLNDGRTTRQVLTNVDSVSNEISYHHVKKIRGYKHSDSVKIETVN